LGVKALSARCGLCLLPELDGWWSASSASSRAARRSCWWIFIVALPTGADRRPPSSGRRPWSCCARPATPIHITGPASSLWEIRTDMLDPLLRRFVDAEDETEASQELNALIEQHALPLAKTIVGRKLRSYREDGRD